MDKLELINTVKNLTGSTNIENLIQASDKLGNYLNGTSSSISIHPFLNHVSEDIRHFTPTLAIQHPTKGLLPVALYDFQSNALHQLSNFSGNKIAIASARQMGWTTMLASYIVHQALLKPETHYLILANKYAASRGVIEK